MFSPVVIGYSMYPPSLTLFNFDTDDLFCVKKTRNEKGFFAMVSNTEKSVEKRGDIRVFLRNFNVF